MAKALDSLIAAFLAAAVSADAFAVLNNDFTRANSTFMKRRFEESKTSAMQGRKALDADKKVEKKTFEDIGDVSYLREMKPHVEEGLPGAEMSRQRTRGNRENFDVPEYSGKTRRDLWDGADVPLALENTDRNLSKNTSGKLTSTSAIPNTRNFSATSTPNSWRCPCAKSTNSIFANRIPTNPA